MMAHSGRQRAGKAGRAIFGLGLFVFAAIAPAQAGEEKPVTTPAAAEQPAAAEATAPDPTAQKIPILLVRELRENRYPPLSLLDVAPADDGIGGAKLAIADNNTTGKFMKQDFRLEVVQSAKADELVTEVSKRVNEGTGFIVVDVEPKTVLAIADAIKDKDAVIFNAGSPDESIREEQCRANVKHTSPSRTMLADALSQYLTWKRWHRWFLVVGPSEEDKAYADALRRAAKRFGSKIVEERAFVDARAAGFAMVSPLVNSPS